MNLDQAIITIRETSEDLRSQAANSRAGLYGYRMGKLADGLDEVLEFLAEMSTTEVP